jgi:integrase
MCFVSVRPSWIRFEPSPTRNSGRHHPPRSGYPGNVTRKCSVTDQGQDPDQSRSYAWAVARSFAPLAPAGSRESETHRGRVPGRASQHYSYKSVRHSVRAALRASELIALKWKHVGWETGILQSEFALVEGELKETKSRNNPLPLAEPVLQVLRLWREHTPYRSEEDWIFASPHYDGKTPYTYQILFRRHIRPVIEKVSGIKSSKEAPIGWHTLRRSL